MRFTDFLPFEPRCGEGMASTAVAVHLRTAREAPSRRADGRAERGGPLERRPHLKATLSAAASWLFVSPIILQSLLEVSIFNRSP